MSRSPTSIAVLMTCHNRRETTLRCLRGVETQTGIEDVDVRVFLVDDGSTDGTAQAVATEFPQARILPGDGSLYWTGGMRRAMAAAMDEEFAFYLWLNDDTMLEPDAMRRLLDAYQTLTTPSEPGPIIVGSLRDPVTGECSYGGAVRSSRWHPLRFERIAPKSTPTRCDVFNGNVVLVSGRVAEEVGNLHPDLRHTGGDYEYALRAEREGVSSWVAPGFFGTCSRNPKEGTWREAGLSLKERYRRLLGPKGFPFGPRAAYMAEYGGVLWPLLFATVYITLPIRHVVRRLTARDP